MSERKLKKREITLTKELAGRLKTEHPQFKIFANKCPSRGSRVKEKWNEVFHEQCPPLQPEMDIIIVEPPNPQILPSRPKLRAIEIKLFEKTDGRINQSFYKGIEQALALLQWGFDNVALWQLFGETVSESELRDYGCKTWNYIHGTLQLPIDFTPIKLIGTDIEQMQFRPIQADWRNNLTPLELLKIDDPSFHITYTHPNPLVNTRLMEERFAFKTQIGGKIVYTPGVERLLKEVATLRQFLFE